ncbi:T9SS type A sorting domain-containing protein [Taibaiella koreensis]|uniref:T9SS type A sorting domain-containing protein n=1 Tax=Taibaiella koreensis TaxID=1268548 RepID=UPI000E59D088|nr:T9SS type A sorting domain-containing protein [Taibaiella koreensis]
MKKTLIVSSLLLLTAPCLFAQQNPAAANPFLSPAPLNNVGSQFNMSFDVGNAGTMDISGASEPQMMKFTLSLGKCAPSVNGVVSTIGTDALSGAALAHFDVVYDASIKTFYFTQKANVPMGLVPDGMHALSVHAQVTNLSSSGNDDIGANLNVQPNAAASGASQPTDDDRVEIFTHTTGAPLPVVLNGFNAHSAGCSVALDWSTSKELQFDHFDIERGAGKGFVAIGSVKATGDNSRYDFTDKEAASGLNTYRLKMVDVDGSAIYSDIATAKVNCATTAAIAVFPNPTSSSVQVSSIHAGVTLRLMDATGRLLSEQVAAGNIERIDLSSLPAALYHVQVIENHTVIATTKVSRQ